jgi:hypothetical protein
MQLRLKDKDVESIKKKMLLRFTDLQNLLFVVGKKFFALKYQSLP